MNSTGSFVAIKEVALNNITKEQIAPIQKEINLLKKLNHPNIVKYIVLEYVENGSLSDIVKRFGPLPEKVVAHYMKQVLLGLEYLHNQGVIHRDIKGANILAAKEGHVKLADFGVATRLSENEKINSAVGTPNWMAPEVINSYSVTSACDIWSLGCTILELLTGQPPYYNLNQVTAMLKIANEGLPPLPENISPELKDFLGNCFAKDPARRKTASELLSHPWILQGESEAKGPADTKVGNVTTELSESEQDNTMVPIMRPDVIARGKKHSSKDHPHTHPSDSDPEDDARTAIHMEGGDLGKSTKYSGSKQLRGRSPPAKPNPKNKSDQAPTIIPPLPEAPLESMPANTRWPHIEHTKERTRGVFYPKKNMRGADELRYGKSKRDQHKFRKQQTAQQPLSSGSGGISRIAFSTTNPSGASVGGKFGKWSGEIIAHRNISGISAEEIKRARKDTAQLSAQTAFHLKAGKSTAKHPLDPPDYNNFNTSFTGSDLDMMQNVEESEKEPPIPHLTHTSHLELSAAHSLSTYKAGLSSAKCQQKRFTVDPHGGPDEEPTTMIEALEGDEGSPKDYAGLQAIRESRETLAGQRLGEGKLPSPRQLKFGLIEGVGKQIEEAVKALIEVTDDEEQEVPIDYKETVLAPIVPLWFVITAKKIQAIRENKLLASYVVTTLGFEKLLKLLDKCMVDYNLLHFSFQLINQILSDNPQYQILSLMSGITPYIVRFANPQFPREIRIEAAFFVVQAFSSTKTAVRLFIAGGGIVVLAKFLDLNMDENRDINLMAIDCINSLMQYKLILHADLLGILTKLGIQERLAVAVDSLIHEGDEPTSYKFLLKTLDILGAFAVGPACIQEKICEGSILPLLFDVSRYFDTQCLIKFCSFLRTLANNPLLLNRLENVGIIPLCSMLIKSGLEWKGDSVHELLYEVLQLLHTCCMLYPSRCEQAALSNIVPSLQKLLYNYTSFHKQVLPLMCSFVHASKITRDIIWEYGGPAMYLEQLNPTDEAMNAKILDSIAYWLQVDTVRVEEMLAQDQNINIITQILKRTELIYLNIITIICKLTRVSKGVALALSVHSDFVNEIIHRMTMKDSRVPTEASNPQVVKQGLEILLNICLAHPSPRSFINSHNLYPLFLQVAKTAKSRNLVIIEEIVGTLLNLYNSSGANTGIIQAR